MGAAAVLAGLLLLGAPEPSRPRAAEAARSGDDPGGLAARAARACPLDARAPSLAPGEGGVVAVVIRCEAGVHVQRQAPLRATASASAGLALPRPRLGWAEARGAADATALDVPVTAIAPGACEVRVRLEYFACSAAWCVRQDRALVVPVLVREAAPDPAAGASGTHGLPVEARPCSPADRPSVRVVPAAGGGP